MEDKKGNILNNNNMVYIFNKEIKQEYDEKIEVKVEQDEEINEFIKEEVTIKSEHEQLYKDHTIKEELVIGPEVMQETYINTIIAPKCEHKYKCKNCGGLFKNKKELQNHGHQCLYICDYCQKSFESRNEIKQHIKTSTCHVCGKHFSFSSNLFRHSKIHTGSKLHKCTECDLSFARKDYLQFHMQKHHAHIKSSLFKSRRLPAVCHLCNKEFASRYSRNYHMKYSCPKNSDRMELKRTKWYSCDMCNKGYKYRSSLSAHIMKRHMGVKSSKIHQCDYCGRSYVKKHNLQCHIQWKHMNLKPYSCKYCKEKFTWHSTLATHEMKVHGKVGPNRFKK